MVPVVVYEAIKAIQYKRAYVHVFSLEFADREVRPIVRVLLCSMLQGF